MKIMKSTSAAIVAAAAAAESAAKAATVLAQASEDLAMYAKNETAFMLREQEIEHAKRLVELQNEDPEETTKS